MIFARTCSAFSILVLSCALVPACTAADSSYLGNWKIESAAVAAWADPKALPDPAEMKSLVGKVMVFKAGEIAAPGILQCKGPHYRVVEVPAEGLFQGAFDEMHRRNSAWDPVQLAHKAGFRGSSWKSLQTGCANELDFHFVDAATAQFGLNDYIYTIKKQ